MANSKLRFFLQLNRTCGNSVAGWEEKEMSPPADIIPGLYQEVHSPVANPLWALEVLANRSLAPAHCNLHNIR